MITIFKSNYKFSLAFENGLYAGYTTEKLFSTVAAGGIPIYWGNPEIGFDVNLKRIISVHEFKDIDSCIEEILEIERDPERLMKILSEPLMTPDQQTLVKKSEEDLVGLFLHASETALEGRLLRPMGTTRTNVENLLLPRLKREEQVARKKYLVSKLLKAIGALDLFLATLAQTRAFKDKLRKFTN
jgi:hypothetical protein